MHLIGGLQTNKVKNAVQLFDYIHSLDSEKLADKISNIKKSKIKNKNFYSSQYWKENQKSGINKKIICIFIIIAKT